LPKNSIVKHHVNEESNKLRNYLNILSRLTC